MRRAARMGIGVRGGGSARSAVFLALVLVLVLVLVATPRSGSADDAGRDAAASTPAPPPPATGGPANVTPADLEDVEHMCALLTACERLPLPPGVVPKDFATCARTLYGELASPEAVSFSLTLRDCGLRASSCGELRTCALRGAKPEVCAGRGKIGPVEMCDGDGRAITCAQERVSLVRDCPRGGEQCVVRDGKALCALGSCETDAPAACSPSGTRVVECKKGKLLSLDCGAFGLRCAPQSDGPQCATQGRTCAEGTLRCDGSTSIGCYHGHEVRIDCAARGLSCGVAGDAGAPTIIGACATAVGAVGKGSCDPDGKPTCDGATLRYCAFGQPRGYLCKSMGLSRCVVDDKTGARCVP